MSLFGELGRRNVFRVGIAYAIIAWIVVQVADIVFETIGAPAWVMQTLMLGLALGFAIALIFSWAYEVTPEGVKKEADVDRDTSITGVTGRKLDRVITGLLVVALAYFVWESRISEPDPTPAAIPVAETSPAAIEETETVVSDLSIAVLPFENRSSLADDAFFSEGMHDDLLTTLAKIGSMKVISRTSVMEYADTTKKIPQIAEELGVANILEGGVQRAGNKVRINMQLIDADTDEHLWAEIYDRELTAENLFAIQSEISNAIADALHATLSPEEQESINRAPTDNLEAFDHYMRGRQLIATRQAPKLEQATEEFLSAVELDPDFALAWVGVADSHALLRGYGGLPSLTFEDVRKNAIDRALEIDGRLGEAFASLGSLYESQNLPDEAEQAYLKAIELSPNYATGYHWLAGMLDRNALRIDEALGYARRAAELDPRSAIILANLASNYRATGDYRAALRISRRMVEMFPDFAPSYLGLAFTQLSLGDWLGSVDNFRRAQEIDESSFQALINLTFVYAEIGTDEDQREHRVRFGALNSHFAPPLEIMARAPFDADPQAREILVEAIADDPDVFFAELLGQAALYSEFTDLAFEAFSKSHLGDLRTIELDTAFVAENAYSACHFAWLMLETEGQEARGQELVDASIEFYTGEASSQFQRRYEWPQDICYLLNGETNAALDIIELQQANLYDYNWHWDHRLPMYDSIRDHPRYVAAWSVFEARVDGIREEHRAKENAKPAFEF